MQIEFLKTLWLLRFQKMKKMEEASAWAYQDILDECLVDFGPDDKIISLLQQLVREERYHEKLAEELMQLSLRSHPEGESF